MTKIDFSTVAGCSPSVKKISDCKYSAVLTIYYDSGEKKSLESPPYETENQAIVMATAGSILLMERLSQRRH